MLTRKMIIGMIIAVVVLMNAMCWGTAYYVDPGGDDYDTGLSWENAFATIQMGIYTATNSDTIDVNVGMYYYSPYGNINFSGKAITVRSKDPNNWSIVEATVIDGDNLGPVVTFNNGETSASILEGFTITDGNSIEHGGGIDVNEASPTIRNCIIRNNYAGQRGGGMYNDGGDPTISRCIFRDNASYNDGAGIFNSSGDMTITNSMFIKNDAGYNGGAIYNSNNYATIINCTFSGNTATSYGGAISSSGSYMTLTNCILWGDTINGEPDEIFGTLPVTYSDVEGGYSGAGNINSDPRFIDPNSYDYHLALNSPCIDVGDSNGTYNGQVDIDGNDRVIDSLGKGDGIVDIDMGADETLSGQWWYVKPDGNDAADGNSWDSAFATISHAINQASDYEVVNVAVGTYYETIDFNGVSCTITSTDPYDWSVVAKTIIDGGGYVVKFKNSENTNSVLKGFTITGGELGIYCDGASPSISNCIITDNNSASYGGGMYSINSSPLVSNSVFSENGSDYGGGIYDVNSSPTLISCVFADNFADANGAGMYNRDSSPILINCTFSGNSADGDGGGMYNFGTSDPNLTNCIFWGNAADGSGDEICNDANSDPNFRFCDIEGSGGSGSWDPNFGSDDGNNIDSDPYFADANDPIGPDDMFGTIDDGLRLQMVSFCIDAADGNVAPAMDISGSGRIDISYVNNTGIGDPNYADIGAYESTEIWFVDIDATGNNDGTSWTDAFTDLKDALSGASNGDEIWVAEGTYKPDDVNDVRSVSFELAEGASVYGGFYGTEGGRHQRDWTAYTTILSGDIGTPNDMSDNSYHVVESADNAVLDGFTIIRGNADGSYPDSVGGGMYNYPASTIMNCFFSDNAATAGGGLWNDYGGASVINCVFSNNSASYYGGGVYNSSLGVEFTNCTFSGNEATFDGGAMGSSTYGPKVTNCIFWGDTSEEIFNYNNASPIFSYCNIQGCGGSSGWDPNFGTNGGGNIDIDPCFADANTPAGADGILGTLDDGLRLMADSPCVDAADGNSAPSTDSLGLGRIDINDVNNTGTGTPDYTDIGAYECGHDSDIDGMPDEWEIRYGLDPDDSGDAALDADSDDLSNLNEYLAGTDPTDTDSDDDGMPDGWEVDNDFDPLDSSDASEDADNDGLSNLEEYNNNADPHDTDSDDDYMLDGWEVDNGLEPDDATGNNGANGNLDGDAFVNLCEYLHGSDPNDDSNTPQSTTTITVPTETGSIQWAVDLSIGGDIIEVLPGRYYETIDFNDSAVTLTGIDPNDWWVVESTIIDGNEASNVVVFESGEDASSVLTGLTLTNATYGISCSSSSSPTITRCIIEYNSSHGIYCTDGSPEITNSIIWENTGDGINSSSSTPPTIKNNWIYDNTNGLRFSSASSAGLVRNNTIAYNDSNGIRVDSDTAPTISNCIIWGNNDDLSNCSATYSCIKNGDGGAGNISSDPLFIDKDNDDYRLQRTSPCINAGTGTYPDETDIEGQVRMAKSIDMGADEVCEVHNKVQDTWYSGVDSEGIQDAIDEADEGDVIMVYEWTFSESIDFDDLNITLTSTDPCDWDVIECTIIDADDSDANVVTFNSGQDVDSVLKGFTITGGKNGVCCENSSSPIITTCYIFDNSSDGIACISGSPAIQRCKIGENSGDGINSSSTTPPTIKNSLIYKNEKGISLASAASAATIRNNTIVDNTAYGISVSSGTEPNISNCILWGHDGNDLADCNATYSCIEDINDANGVGNITSDPVFVGEYYALDLQSSPCVGAGDPCETYGSDEVDLYGNELSETPDMGTVQNTAIRTKVGGVAGKGKTWGNAANLHHALKEAKIGKEIWVAKGTYHPKIDRGKPSGSRGASFELKKGVSLYGGFAGNENSRNQRNWKANETVLSGDIGVQGVDTDNSYHVIIGAEGAVLDGMTIEDGKANGEGIDDNGAGMYNYSGSAPAVIKNCTFRNNDALANGGSIKYIGAYTFPSVTNTIFENNTSTGGNGGAIYSQYAIPKIDSCVFVNNNAVKGGAIFNEYNISGCITITNCVFYDNGYGSTVSGGGVYNYLLLQSNIPKVTNCTFHENKATYGNSVHNAMSYSPIITNCIMWNVAEQGDEVYNSLFSSPTITYCDIKVDPEEDPVYPGTGNIKTDPKFVNAEDADGWDNQFRTFYDGLRLDFDSPCIDAGDSTAVNELYDIVSNTRKMDDPYTYNTGNGSPPVDMGAYEFEQITKKEPYLIHPGEASPSTKAQMMVLWQLNNVERTCTLRWGTDENYGNSTQTTELAGTPLHRHRHKITDLNLSTKYYYRISGVGAGTFYTSPASTVTSVKFLAYGDTRGEDNVTPVGHDQVCDRMVQTYKGDSDFQTFALHVGDYVDYGESDYDWQNEFFKRSQNNVMDFLANMPLVGCMGNHEHNIMTFCESRYSKYYPFPGTTSDTDDWFEFKYGPVHVVVVNEYRREASGIGGGKTLDETKGGALDQVKFALENSDREWTFMMFHAPAYSAGGGHDNNPHPIDQLEAWINNYVDIVFAGHNHYYARCEIDGVRHITTGGGGAPEKTPIDPPGDSAHPGIKKSDGGEDKFHHCEITISGTSIQLVARRADNSEIETVSWSH